jgi:hypothetical protein
MCRCFYVGRVGGASTYVYICIYKEGKRCSYHWMGEERASEREREMDSLTFLCSSLSLPPYIFSKAMSTSFACSVAT